MYFFVTITGQRVTLPEIETHTSKSIGYVGQSNRNPTLSSWTGTFLAPQPRLVDRVDFITRAFIGFVCRTRFVEAVTTAL